MVSLREPSLTFDAQYSQNIPSTVLLTLACCASSLQNLSGAQIDVPAECEPGTSVRHIQIRGDDKAVREVCVCVRVRVYGC